MTFEQGHGFEGSGFVHVAAVMRPAVDAFLVDVFGNHPFALPEKLGGFAVHVFGDASAKGVVAVVAHEALAGAAWFADEICTRYSDSFIE